MARSVALFLLMSFASVAFCGFLVNQQLTRTQHAAHMDQAPAEHHLMMWDELSTAVVSDIAAYVTALALVAASVFVLAETPFLSLHAYALIRSYDPVPIRKKERIRISPEVRRWLSRFELSPSAA